MKKTFLTILCVSFVCAYGQTDNFEMNEDINIQEHEFNEINEKFLVENRLDEYLDKNLIDDPETGFRVEHKVEGE